jgi:PASTA domain-containing protein
VKNFYRKSISPLNARLTLLFDLLLMVAALGPQLHASNHPGSYGVTPYIPWSDVNLVYDNGTGTVAVVSSPTGFGMPPMVSENWSTTWTHIVPGRFGGGPGSWSDFLFYDQNSGVAEFYSFSVNWTTPPTPVWTLLKRYTDWSPGHTIIVPGNFGGVSVTGQTDLLIYDGATGNAGFYDVWGQANVNLMKTYNDWSPGHSIIVPGIFGGTSVTGQSDLLIYDRATGNAGFYDVWGQGNINLMKSYNNWSTTHTIIVPGNFGGIGQTDLLIYDGATGNAGFYDVWGQGNINLMKSYNNWSPGDAFILPGDFEGENMGQTGQTDLLIYNGLTNSEGFFDVWGQGNLNSLGPNPFPFSPNHWSLMTASFQVVPQIFSLSPKSGPVGTVVTLQGKNLNGAQRVVQGVDSSFNGDPVSFNDSSSTTITATMSTGDSVDTGWMGVTTPAGKVISSITFVAQSHVSTAVVPNVVGQTLQAAVQILHQAGLQQGTVSGATGFSLMVVSQSPAAGTRVNSGSSVNLVVTAAQNGVSSATLTNDLPDDQSVYVWLYDGSTGAWSQQNNDNLLAPGYSVTINFSTQATYTVYAVNPAWCSGDNDPSNPNCVPWQNAFTGNPQGPMFTGYME